MSEIDAVAEALSRMTPEQRAQVLRGLERRCVPEHEVFIVTPQAAFDYARVHGGSDYLRRVACGSPKWAVHYALSVDKAPHDLTRESASATRDCALWYAEDVDKGPHDVTRRGACQGRLGAYDYARRIDRGYHPETWEVIRGTQIELRYRRLPGFPKEES